MDDSFAHDLDQASSFVQKLVALTFEGPRKKSTFKILHEKDCD